MKIKFHWDKQATPALILQKFNLSVFLVFQWKSNGKLSLVLIYVLPKGKGMGKSCLLFFLRLQKKCRDHGKTGGY